MLPQWQPNLEVKEVEILSEYDGLGDIKRGIITRFGIKSIENKEWLSCSVLMLIILLTLEQM